MGLRRIGLMLLVAAAVGTACSGGDAVDGEAAIGLDRPIGAPAGSRTAARDAGTPGPDPAVAKSAFATMEVPKSGLDSAAQRVVDIATAPDMGGFLVSSVFDTQEAHGTARVVVKVPSPSFEQAVARLSGIGDVTRQELEGQDMTPEVLAAHARLQRARARTADILRQLEAAEDEATTFELRERLRAARARLRSAHQKATFVGGDVAFSSIDVALHATPAPPAPEKPVIERALATAKSLTIGIASAAALIAAVILPILTLLVLLYALGRPIVRRLKPRLQGWPG